MESLRANYRDEDEEDDEPINQTQPIKEEAEISDAVVSEEEISEEEEEEIEEEEPLTPLTKKHRPLSSLIPQTVLKKPKNKTKPKLNNVWKSTSRKGKKKSNKQPTAAHQLFDEKSVLISAIPRVVDKNDDAPELKICLSKVNKAEKVELSENRLSAGSSKGYRMVRATRGVVKGAWYFEIKVEMLGETGHTRLGWSTEKGDLQAPVGYDGNSYGYRDVDGSKIHKAMREKYGDGGYVEGDVIGFYINLPDGDIYVPKTPDLVWYKGQKFSCAANGNEESNKVVPGSEISFFKNGVWQGIAFKDLYGGCYYPAASMYTLPNQPNCVVKFNFGPEFEFFPEDFGDRPLPKPMSEVPYQVFNGVVALENGESTEKTLQQSS